MADPVTVSDKIYTNLMIATHVSPVFGDDILKAYNEFKCLVYTANPITNQMEPLFTASPGNNNVTEWATVAKNNQSVYIYGADDMSPRAIIFNGINEAPTISELPLNQMAPPPERSTGRIFLDAICEFFTGKKTLKGQQMQAKVDAYNFFKNRELVRAPEINDIKNEIVNQKINSFTAPIIQEYESVTEIDRRLDRLMSATSTANEKDIINSQNLVANKVVLPNGVSNSEYVALSIAASIRMENLTSINKPASSTLMPKITNPDDALRREYDGNRMYLIHNAYSDGYDRRIGVITESIIKTRAQSQTIANEMSKGNFTNAGIVMNEGLNEYVREWNDIINKTSTSGLAVGISIKKMLNVLEQNPNLNKAAGISDELLNKCRSIIAFNDLYLSNVETTNRLYVKQDIPKEQVSQTIKNLISNNMLFNSVYLEVDGINKVATEKERVEALKVAKSKIKALNTNTNLSPEAKGQEISNINNQAYDAATANVRKVRLNSPLPKSLVNYLNNPEGVSQTMQSYVEKAPEFKRCLNVTATQLVTSLAVNNPTSYNDFSKELQTQAIDLKKEDAKKKQEKDKAKEKKIQETKKVQRAAVK